MKKICKFLKLDNAHKLLIMEAVFWLCLAKVAIHAASFRKLSELLGKHMHKAAPSISTTNEKNTVANVSYAIWTASESLPFGAKCLVRATAGKWMLWRHGYASTLFLGATMNDEKGLHAHAWLKCGDIFVAGFNGHQEFKVVSYFGGLK